MNVNELLHIVVLQLKVLGTAKDTINDHVIAGR